MNARRTQRQEKVVDIGDKSKLTQAQVKPFVGKVFYLDLPSNRKAETLENDIKELGGTVEKFFSKEIKYLVSNKREARYVQNLRRDSPVPSPESGPSSGYPRPNPHPPGSPRDNVKGRSHNQTDTFSTSRGKSLVERVVKEQERIQIHKILSTALEWGVKILYIDDVIACVEKKKKNIINQCTVTTAVKTNAKAESIQSQGFQKCKDGRLSKPFVKVEDSSRHYRPICLNMPNMPEFNLKTVPPSSPFCVEDKDRSGKRQRGHRFLGNRAARASASEEEGQGRPRKNRDKKRGGYCECCMLKYDNLKVHLQSECHKAFSRSDAYLVVDRLVSTLQCQFIPIKTKANRPKCSISSILMAPGPYAKTEQRHEAETKECQDTLWDVPDCGELPRRHSLKCSSVPGSAPIIHSESDKKNSCMESVVVGHVLPEETTGVSQCAGATVPTQSHSPVRRIQRRRVDFKRKRRKVDTTVTYPKSDDVPGNAILSLWQLFQSSEDMDGEFLGFDD